MKKLRFNEKTHSYYLGKKRLASVTQFIGDYFDKFDAKKVAKKLKSFHPKYKGRTIKDITSEWTKASEQGTEYHAEIEAFIKGHKKITEFVDNPRVLGAIEYFLEATGSGEPFVAKPEMKVHSEELMLAGTIDCPIVYGGNKVIIIDWKFVKNISKKPYKLKYAKKPLDKLYDCNYNKYALQLNMYAYILEKYYAYEVEAIVLVHIDEEGETHQYPVKKSFDIVEAMLIESGRLTKKD